jgi:uncharacterized membrane protein (UPF0127 family)
MLSFVLVLLTLACGASDNSDTDAAPVLPFTTARVRLISGADTVVLLAELAETEEQHALGLMERRHLADTAGMLFLYPSEQEATAGFWMFRTRIPLDIAFADSLGAIRAIHHMVPCTATIVQGCPSYPPGARYRAALEVNAGYLARHRLDVGSRIVLRDTSRRVGP